jgi:cytochrome c biogenesis protein CcmG/thiol:disulfide interchange protein DsbE
LPAVGHEAPAISGAALDGSSVSLASLRGHPVVINFWASWCTPCRDEFPVFRDKLTSLGTTDGLEVVGVLYKDEADLAKSFVGAFGATWPTVVDPDGAIADAYRITAPPQTFFVDKDGIIRAVQIGEITSAVFDTLYAKIKP